MGSTFGMALMRVDKARAKSLAKEMKAYFRKNGYRCVRSAEDADRTIQLYLDQSWVMFAGDYFNISSTEEDIQEMNLLACSLREPIIHISNWDSDCLLATLCSGTQTETLQYGMMKDGEEEPSMPRHTPLWDAYLGAQATAFYALFAPESDRTFSEELLGEAAPITGWSELIANFGFEEALEDVKPFASIYLKKQAAPIPMLRDPSEPPAFFAQNLPSFSTNPLIVQSFDSCGGESKGIRVEIWAENYDANLHEIPKVCLHSMDTPASPFHDEFAVPVRHHFDDGRNGWIAEFPDAVIPCGINMNSPAMRTAKGVNYRTQNRKCFYAAVYGPACKPMNVDPSNVADFLALLLPFMSKESAEARTWVRFIPMENSDGPTVALYSPLLQPTDEFVTRFNLE